MCVVMSFTASLVSCHVYLGTKEILSRMEIILYIFKVLYKTLKCPFLLEMDELNLTELN